MTKRSFRCTRCLVTAAIEVTILFSQVHTTGMDIQHKLDAVAALTLGKDMCLGIFDHETRTSHEGVMGNRQMVHDNLSSQKV